MSIVDQFLNPSSQQTTPRGTLGTAGLVGAEAVRTVAGILPKAVYDVATAGTDFLDWTGATDINAPSFQEFMSTNFSDGLALTLAPQTKYGQVAQEVGTMLTGFGLVGKLKWISRAKKLKGFLSPARLGASVAQGAMADFIFSDPTAPRLADLFPKATHNAVLKFLQSDPNDSRIASRLKSTLEGGLIGVGADVAIEGGLRFLKLLRGKVDEVAQVAPRLADKIIQDSTGLVSQAADSTPAVQPLYKSLHQIPAESVSSLKEISRQAAVLMEEAMHMSAGKSKLAVDTGMDAITRLRELGPDMQIAVVEEAISDLFNRQVLTHGLDEASQNQLDRLLQVTGQMLEDNGGFVGQAPQTVASWQAKVDNLYKIIPTDSKVLRYAKRTFKSTKDLPVQVAFFQSYIKTAGLDIAKDASEIVKNGLQNDSQKVRFFARMMNFLDIGSYSRGIVSTAGRTLRATQRDVAKYMVHNADGVLVDLTTQSDEMVGSLLGISPEQVSQLRNGIPLSDKDFIKLAQKIVEANGDLDKMAKAIAEPSNVLGRAIEELSITNMLSGFATQVVLPVAGATMRIGMDFIDDAYTKFFLGATGHKELAADIHLAAQLRGAADGLTGYVKRFVKEAKGDWRTLITDAPDIARRAGEMGQNIAEAEGLSRKAIIDSELKYASIFNDRWSPFRAFHPEKPMGKVLFKFVVNPYGIAARQAGFGLMSTIDGAVSSAAFRMKAVEEIERLSHRFAGELGPDAIAAWRKNFYDLLVKWRGDAFLDIDKETASLLHKVNHAAMDNAKRSTYRDDLPDTWETLNKLASRNTPLSSMARVILWPFRKTPINILRAVGERTPVLNLLSQRTRKALAGDLGQLEKARAIARMVDGAALYSTGLALAASGRITGRHPLETRDSLKAAGIPEYAIVLPSGKMVQYNRMDPVGFYFGVTADIYTILSRGEAVEPDRLAASGLLAFSSNVLNKTWFKGIADAAEALDSDNEKFLSRWATEKFSTFTAPLPVPGANLQRDVRSLFTDQVDWRPTPEMAEFDTYLQRLFQEQAVVRPFLPIQQKRDILGQNVVKDGSAVGKALTLAGLRSWEPTKSPGLMELAKYNMVPKDRPRTFRGERLTQFEHHDFKGILGASGLIEKLDSIVQSQKYAALSGEARKDVLDRVVDRFFAASLQTLAASSPDLRQRAAEKLRAHLEAYNALPEPVSRAGDFNSLRGLIQPPTK